MDPQEIKTLIEQGLSGATVEIGGDGRHFQAIIVFAGFAGKSPIQRHRQVYEVLEAYIKSDQLHALSMRTLTPEEANA